MGAKNMTREARDMELQWFDIRELTEDAAQTVIGMMDETRRRRVADIAGEDDREAHHRRRAAGAADACAVAGLRGEGRAASVGRAGQAQRGKGWRVCVREPLRPRGRYA